MFFGLDLNTIFVVSILISKMLSLNLNFL